MIQRSDRIASRKRGRLSSSAWNTCCPKRPLGPRRQKAPSETTRLEPPATARLPEGSSERVSPEQTSRTVHLKNPIARRRPLSERTRRNCQRPRQHRPVAIRPDIRPKTAEVPVEPTGTNWVVSETTSPVDYSPLVTAVIQSTSPVKDAPTALAVRCREKHTELLVRTDGTWTTTGGNELRVDYQINDQPAVRLPWSASADGKTASYKDDAVGLLQSLPEGARLKINVFDGPGQATTRRSNSPDWMPSEKKLRRHAIGANSK